VLLNEDTKQNSHSMKTLNCLIICLTTLTFTPAFGQQPPVPGASFSEKIDKIVADASGNAAPALTLTKFNLDFPGGTPKELVTAIQKATGKPLNAIIPDEHASIKLPPLKMNNVDVPRLFQTLQLASSKTEAYVISTYYGAVYPGGPQQYQSMVTSYGFRTTGTPTDDSIWYFYAEKPGYPPLAQSKACRFYLLTPYLDRDLTVDDVITAIQTGWRMLGDKETPTISFHKETKLLIAVGEASKLDTIDAVLRALEPPSGRRGGFGGGLRGGFGAPATPPAEKPKADQ
jgi:hypothetical protein